MGGAAFAVAVAEGEPTLRTPRMSPETYRLLKEILLKKLQAYFPTGKIVSLIEAPEKKDYGDLDIFVALNETVDFMILAEHLGAAGIICHDPTKATFAVPRDGTPSECPCVVYRDTNTISSNSKVESAPSSSIDEFAQLDVAMISPDLLDWYTFYSSHSDMNGLLGHIVTQLGFTVTDRGFWLRLPELDFSKTVNYVNLADRDGMILLSSDSSKVIEFLGCSVEDYQRGFETLDGFYAWLGACRLISADALKIKRDKAHERNREEKRTVYSKFFNEWLPARMDVTSTQDGEARAGTVRCLREQYLQEAADFFSKRDECDIKRNALVLAINNGLAGALLKSLIAEHSGKSDKSVNEILKACRRYITFDEMSQPVILSQPHTDAESELHRFLDDDQRSLRGPDTVNEWVKNNWEELKALEKKRVKPGDEMQSQRTGEA